MSNESKECREKGTATEDELKKGQDSVEADAEDRPSKEKDFAKKLAARHRSA